MSRHLTSLVVFTLLFGFCTPLAAQRGRARRVDRLLTAPGFERTLWGIVLMDTTGRVLYQHNGDHLFVPASNTKLVVTSAAMALLDSGYTVTTDVYGTGPVVDGWLHGALVIRGHGDPTFSERCYDTDTLALGACDWLWKRMDMLADSIAAAGIRVVDGPIVGDGSWFEATRVHPAWETYDLAWWYAAPVSALGFNDNSVNIRYRPGVAAGAPPIVSFEPNLDLFRFENRAVTTDSGPTTIDFFRDDDADLVWSEGTIPVGRRPRTEYLALPDPDRYFAAALRQALAARGIAVAGATESTHDSTDYAELYANAEPLVRFHSRPLADWLFPVLNTSQNWFAEMLLKQLGLAMGSAGSWDDGLAVERTFLVDTVGLDSTAFALEDGSGLSHGNLMAPHAFAQLLAYDWRHPNRAVFLRGLPRSGQVGSLEERFVGTPLEGRVQAKTGSINHVNTLSGYILRERGGPLVFSVMANNRTAPYDQMLAQIDSVVVQLGR